MILFYIIKKEWLKHLRHPLMLLIYLLLPALTFNLSVYFSHTSSTHKLGIVNLSSNQSISSGHFKWVQDSHLYSLSLEDASPNTYRADLLLGKYQGILLQRDAHSLEVICLDKDLKETLSSIDFFHMIPSTSTDTVPNLSSNLTRTVPALSLNSSTLNINIGKALGYLFLTFLITSTLMMSSLIKEDIDHVIHRTKLSCTSSSTLIIGYLLTYLGMGFIQLIVTVIIARLLSHSITFSIPKLTCLGLITMILAVLLALFIVNLCATDLQASSYVTTLAILLSMLGGLFVPYDKLPYGMQIASYISPISWLQTLCHTLNTLSYASILLICSILLTFILCLAFNKYKGGVAK